MKKIRAYFLSLSLILIAFQVRSQVSAPSLRCISVNDPSGDITLNWVIPSDPSSQFVSYEIFSSATQFGTYASVGMVNVYTQTSFTHIGANANISAKFYYLKTISTGPVSSTSSDTLRSMFLNLVNLSSGIAVLSWNRTHNPSLPTAATTYTVLRQSPPGAFLPIHTGSTLNFRDTISKCSIFYNYKVRISDASGCISESSVDGDLFQDNNHFYAPTLDSVSVNANGSITLGWEPSPSADAVVYYIFKEFAGGWTKVDSVFGYNNTSCTYTGSAPGGQSEHYCLASKDSCGNISILGLQGAQKTIYLTTNYKMCSRSVDLSWTSYINLQKGVLQYDVYCSINSGVFSLIGSSVNTAFTHTQLNPGDSYCYFVKVRNTDLSISANSNRSCIVANAPSGPAYVYVRSVSVNDAKQVVVTYMVDNSKQFKGAAIFRSLDGVNFTQLSFNSSTTNSIQVYTDTDVSPTEKNYYYKVQIVDSCGNPGNLSNTSKTVLLSVTNNNENIFYNTLTWDDYSSWSGSVASYNIYRAVNGVFSPTPIDNVAFGTNTYIDNVEDFVSDEGKFSYYVEAVEGPGNIYGLNDVARSNAADAYVEVNVFVPNAFAPKGLNNIWLPVAQYVEKTDYKVMVFNRWGTKVFETGSDIQGWDGSGATDDMYVYLVEYKNARGEYIQLKGHLNIIR